MAPIKLENGNLLVPSSVELPNGTVIDIQKEIGPDDPEYKNWLRFLPKEQQDK